MPSILVVSYPRSGYNLTHNILERYFGIRFSGCMPEQENIPQTKETLFYRSHDFSNKINKTSDKYIILYRKDVVSQIDAYVRYTSNPLKNIKATSLDHHGKFHGDELSYKNHIPFIQRVFSYYLLWKNKWVDTPTPNSIFIEYDSFMKHPKETIDELSIFMGIPVDSAQIVKDLNIEYKHSISAEKYNELKKILETLSLPPKSTGLSFERGRIRLKTVR